MPPVPRVFRRRLARLTLGLFWTACSSSGGPDSRIGAAEPSAPADAPAPAAAPAPKTATTPPSASTRSGPPARPREEASRITLTLRSTPSGAEAAIDGRPVGVTPLTVELEHDRKPRDFTFVLPGHEMARYRFVPVRDGLVHARLKPLAPPP